MEKAVRKSLWFIIVLVLLLGGGFFVITGFGPSDGPGWKQGFHGRGMPACLQKEIGSFILWKMDRHAKELNLTDPQQKAYNDFRSHMESLMSKAVDARMSVRSQAKEQYGRDVMDLSMMAGVIKKELDAVSNAAGRGLELFSAYYDTLDENQKKQVTAHIREKIDCRRSF